MQTVGGEKEQIHETQNKHTCSSKNYRFFKSGEDQETCGGDLISLFLKDNAPTAKETFNTQDKLVSVNKIEEYKGDSI